MATKTTAEEEPIFGYLERKLRMAPDFGSAVGKIPRDSPQKSYSTCSC